MTPMPTNVFEITITVYSKDKIPEIAKREIMEETTHTAEEQLNDWKYHNFNHEIYCIGDYN